jgi:hypothetical protein
MMRKEIGELNAKLSAMQKGSADWKPLTTRRRNDFIRLYFSSYDTAHAISRATNHSEKTGK